jgi:tripartite-type tricarboxylate transporter receptor subunit TctC
VVGRSPLVLAVGNQIPVKSVRELIDYAKTNVGKVNHSSPGVGTSPHLADELFRMLAGFESQHVAYKSSPQVLAALIQGETQWAFDVPLTALPQHVNGKLRVIAIASTARNPAHPDIPTLAEQGFPDVSMYAWFAMAAPAGTPKDIVDKLGAEITKALKTDAIKARFAAIGFEPAPMSSAETGKFFLEERARWTKVIQANNIKGE